MAQTSDKMRKWYKIFLDRANANKRADKMIQSMDGVKYKSIKKKINS